MGWRDRVKKSFGDSEHIGEGGKNLKNQEKERKEGSKRTFISYPHNPQNPQNRQNEGEKPKTDQGITNSMVKDQITPKMAPGDLSQPPVGGTPEYKKLWAEAWTLADWIDDPNGAPIEKRRARLPELDDLRGRMASIVRQAVPPAGPEPKPSLPGTWMPWESIGGTTRDTSQETCPAQCRRSGKCYSKAYFEGKPGKAKDCEPDGCKHISNERGNHDSETVGSF